MIVIIKEELSLRDKIVLTCRQISRIHAKLEKAWQNFAQNPSDENANKIDVLQECLLDYQKELDDLLEDE